MVYRKNPKCIFCGGKIKGVYKPTENFYGDSFIKWDYENHVCRLGIVYFIERMDTHEWFTGETYTNNPNDAMVFKTKELAEKFLKKWEKEENFDGLSKLELVITEHEFLNNIQNGK